MCEQAWVASTALWRVAKAAAHGLPPLLITALVEQESAGDPYAWNPEPRYRYLWDVKRNAPFRTPTEAERASEIPPHDFPTLGGDRDQEWWGQQASWGLMQVMGAVARELRAIITALNKDAQRHPASPLTPDASPVSK